MKDYKDPLRQEMSNYIHRGPRNIQLSKEHEGEDAWKNPNISDIGGLAAPIVNMMSLHAEELRKRNQDLIVTSQYSDRVPKQMKYAHKRKHAYDSRVVPRDIGDEVSGVIEERMPEHLFVNQDPKLKSQRPSEYHKNDAPHYHQQLLLDGIKKMNKDDMLRALERYKGSTLYMENELTGENPQDKAELIDTMRANHAKWAKEVEKGLNPWMK